MQHNKGTITRCGFKNRNINYQIFLRGFELQYDRSLMKNPEINLYVAIKEKDSK
jgi:hypothetical protein